MKKSYLVLVLTFLMTFLFVGCGKKPTISLPDGNSIELTVGDTFQLNAKIENGKEGLKVVATTTSDAIIINGLNIEAKKAGEAVVEVMIEGNEKSKMNFYVTVENKYLTEIKVKGEQNLVVGSTATYTLELAPDDATVKEVDWKSTNEKVVTIDNNGNAKAMGKGVARIIAISKDGSEVQGDIEVTVQEKDSEAPEIYIDGALTQQDLTINYNDKFDPMLGMKAVDNLDGDISSKIKVHGRVNNHVMGDYELTYTVEDLQGNVSEEFKRVITVKWNSTVTFIGHAGCYSGIMNTEQAFRNAFAVHGYQGIECDVKQTKDGVYVTCHDNDFNGKPLADTNWDEIKDEVEVKNRGGKEYRSRICTFRKYLQIAKEYGGFCVVELKSSKGITNADQSRMAPLMEIIKEEGMLHNVVFLGSQYKCLEWVRDNGYDYIPCQYLVSSCESADTLAYCIEHNFDISFNVTRPNSQEWINRYHEAGLKVACYTFSQYTNANDLQLWINRGVDFVTVDETRPYEVTLPIKSDKPLQTFEVTFKDFDGKVLKKTTVEEGKGAATPFDPVRFGYTFIGWDKDTSAVKENMVVTAKYELATYIIRYEKNNVIGTKSAWKDKDDFVNDLYTDMYNWLDKMVGKIEGLTKTGNEYELTRNGVSAKWTDVASLKNVDKYVFEKTISNIMYKPLESREGGAVNPETDPNYFLNTEPYRTKYQEMDGYLLNCINKSYPGYNNTYTPTGAGKVQIFFRFQQWVQGTNIAPFNELPAKYDVVVLDNYNITLPTTNTTYTIESEFTLDPAKCNELEFTGWYLDVACTKKITEIKKNSSGDLVLYAGWKQKA